MRFVRFGNGLCSKDAFLIGERYEDQRDKAFQAAITASSERALGGAVNVISGQNRAVQVREESVQIVCSQELIAG